MSRREHWQRIYQSHPSTELSWYQAMPGVSLQFIEELKVKRDASIIDIGGGDSNLVDHLLARGYTDITVLDISPAALGKAKHRLGIKASLVNWIEADITHFESQRKYDFWHDRAVLHFLTTDQEVDSYFKTANNSIKEGGKILLGTFSTEGPEKCSGLPVQRYSQETITSKAKKFFEKIKCITTEHLTPFNTIQQFLYCSFLKSTNRYGHS
jgi:2-polyprenyl-3-methyl-5-hydroxy-6-metoxy-1,4-benzoquinol methylase